MPLQQFCHPAPCQDSSWADACGALHEQCCTSCTCKLSVIGSWTDAGRGPAQGHLKEQGLKAAVVTTRTTIPVLIQYRLSADAV